MTDVDRVQIRAIAGGGDGVATLADGRTVFVPRTAPGDDLTLRQVRRQPRFARAEVATILTPGPGRVTPPCPHYVVDRCGSCQLQHLDAATQLEARQRMVGDALRRIARLDQPDPVITAPGPAFGYRASITLTVRRGVIGYHRLGAPDQIADIRDCLLARDAIRGLLRAVRGARELLPPDVEHLVLREDTDGGTHVVVRTAGRGGWTTAAAFAARLDPLTHVWWHPAGGAARVMAGGDDPWPATIFAQVNPVVAGRVRDAAVEALGDVAGRRIWDLYAGAGEATAMLHARGASVTSVERDARAVALATRRGPHGPNRHAGDVADWIGRLERPHAALVNPPRVGLESPACDALAASGAAVIVYVSCDPATLARDLRRLTDRYRVLTVSAWDQFPQTAHVESIAVLEAT
jgi:23S rRNA (uracil1939-C5)-methyltransferase